MGNVSKKMKLELYSGRYYNSWLLEQPVATRDKIKDGWLHTGDLVCSDSEGYLYLKGEKMICIFRWRKYLSARD
jgi:acyl-CoA synthetase (AMP-forming)/AMP-acid ligase II